MSVASHQLGQDGEAVAADFLIQLGFEVIFRSYRHKRAEVDLVVRRGQELLVFVEVKTRSNTAFGHPETFVSARKKELFQLAATQLQEDLNWTGDIRFDIVALTLRGNGFQIDHFEDAFY